MPDIFRQMKVIRWPLDYVKWYHTTGTMKGLPYHSTECHGVYVEVGRDSGKYVGKHEYPQGEDEVGVRWPAAKDVFRRLNASRREKETDVERKQSADGEAQGQVVLPFEQEADSFDDVPILA